MSGTDRTDRRPVSSPCLGCSTRTRQVASSGKESPAATVRSGIRAWRASRSSSPTAAVSRRRNISDTTISPIENRSIRSGTALKWSASAWEITNVSMCPIPSSQSTPSIARRAAPGAPRRPASYTRHRPAGLRTSTPQPCPIDAAIIRSPAGRGAAAPSTRLPTSPTMIHPPATSPHASGCRRRSRETHSRDAVRQAYQPISHHPCGPATQA